MFGGGDFLRTVEYGELQVEIAGAARPRPAVDGRVTEALVNVHSPVMLLSCDPHSIGISLRFCPLNSISFPCSAFLG